MQWRKSTHRPRGRARSSRADWRNYLTLTIDEDTARADRRMDGFMENYYGQPPSVMRGRQANYAGPAAGAAAWLKSYVDEGASHLVLRFAGDAVRNMETIARLRGELGW